MSAGLLLRRQAAAGSSGQDGFPFPRTKQSAHCQRSVTNEGAFAEATRGRSARAARPGASALVTGRSVDEKSGNSIAFRKMDEKLVGVQLP
jgi:hypothetical protein